MRLLLIHNELTYFGGASRMFLYFVGALAKTGCEFTVSAVPGSRIMASLPCGVPVVEVSDNGGMSLSKLLRQVQTLRNYRKDFAFDLVHGWTARDWELAAALGRISHCPVVGTLHDHPKAQYISRKRQWLMRASARWGLDRVVCVSNAVRAACRQAGYPCKLVVIHNGVPPGNRVLTKPPSQTLRLGYMGILSEPKGVGAMFDILDRLSKISDAAWEFHVAGSAQQASAGQFLEAIRCKYCTATWWPRVRWHGWIESPFDFVASLDLLIFPSIMFDSFPNVLLEAAWAGVPVLAAEVGGVAEIVEHGLSGWLFTPGNSAEACVSLAQLMQDRLALERAGEAARQRANLKFGVEKMVEAYQSLYLTFPQHG